MNVKKMYEDYCELKQKHIFLKDDFEKLCKLVLEDNFTLYEIREMTKLIKSKSE